MSVEDPHIPKVPGKIIPPKMEGEPEPDMADMYLKLRRQKAAEEMIAREFPQEKQNPTQAKTQGATNQSQADEPIQATIVKSAIDMYKDTMAEVHKTLRDKEGALQKAVDDKNSAMAAYYQVQVDNIKSVSDKVDQALKDMKVTNQPKTAIDAFKEAQDLIKYVEQMSPRQPVSESPGVPFQAQMELQKMLYQHDIDMKKLELEMHQVAQSHQLELLKFDDERKRKWTEYEDQKDMRQSGFGGLQDLLNSVAANISAERQGQQPPAKTSQAVGSQPPSPSQEPGLEAHISKFSCTQCEYPVTVGPGQSKAICEQCGAEYNITPKEQ
jgi:hypothetical protein